MKAKLIVPQPGVTPLNVLTFKHFVNNSGLEIL